MADDDEEVGEEENSNNLGVRLTIVFQSNIDLLYVFVSLMKVIEMRRMNDMVSVKQHYRMEIPMKVNIRMANDTALEPIDSPILLVMLVSSIILTLTTEIDFSNVCK